MSFINPATPALPELGELDVHVWAAELTSDAPLLEEWQAVLSSQELDRTRRFRRPADAQRYLASHAILRFLLARYVGAAPAELEFIEDEFGKPHLRAANVSFNLSHSGEMALYGVTRQRRIGVDVEHIRRGVEMLDIARRFFAPGETATLSALAEEQKAEAFFNCWTRKEAYLKACGCGLRGDTRAIEVSLEPGAPPVILREGGEPSGRRWSVLHWTPGAEYIAAAVAEGSDVRFSNHWWRP